MANTTWSTSDKINVTLSGSNLIATASGVGGARAADAQVTGLFYWETTVGTWGNANTGVGAAWGGVSLATISTAANGGGVIVFKSGNIWVNGVSSGSSLGARAAGNVICHALNLTTGTYWSRVGSAGNWNGSASANPATGVGGLNLAALGSPGGFALYPAVSLGATSDAVTANFGDSAFTGTPPSGYTSGFTSGAAPPTSLAVSQAGLEAFIVGASDLRVTQAGFEAWISTTAAPVNTLGPSGMLFG